MSNAVTTSLFGNVEDERSPLEQLRLRELMKIADKNNIPYPPLATKGVLLRLLEGMALVENLAEYFGSAASEKVPTLKMPSQEAIDAARDEMRGTLEAMDAVTFVAWCKENDIDVKGTVPNKANRQSIIDEYMNAL